MVRPLRQHTQVLVVMPAVGIEGDDEAERVESFKRTHANDLARRFGYFGTAGDRNQHVMTGCVV